MTAADSASDVTVVVPTRNSGATLRACLESIRSQSFPCTLVVVDNGSTDATPLIANQLADLFLLVGPERSAQRNAGAAATASRIIGFVDSDMALSPTVIAEAVAAINAGAASVVVPEETVGEGFWADVSAYERSFYEGSETIEAPRFFPRNVFEDVGGFDEAMTGAKTGTWGCERLGQDSEFESTPRLFITKVMSAISISAGRRRIMHRAWRSL